MSGYREFRLKFLRALYLETEEKGFEYFEAGLLSQKYRLCPKPHWIRRLADDSKMYLEDVAETHDTYDTWEFKMSAEGCTLAESENESSGLIVDFDNEVPASDRIVSRDDNQILLGDISVELETLSTLAKSQDNEIGAQIGDQREIIDSEISFAKDVIAQPRFRLASLVGWLRPLLRFLADKFAGGAIADAAKRLLDLLLSLVG